MLETPQELRLLPVNPLNAGLPLGEASSDQVV